MTGCAAAAGEGLFVLKVGGHGRLCANSYGGIMRYVLRQGEVRARLEQRLLTRVPLCIVMMPIWPRVSSALLPSVGEISP